MYVRIELEEFVRNCVSIKDLAINQNQNSPVGSTSYIIKYKFIFILCIVRKMSARIVCLLMIRTLIEIYLSIDRCEKYGIFRDHGSHARMRCLTI